MIRFMCVADASGPGQLALSYADALANSGAVFRIVATTGLELSPTAKRGTPQDAPSPWQRHAGALIAPMTSPWVNLVCVPPHDWARLHTANVINLLLADRPPSGPPLAAAARYYAVIVPDDDLARAWREVGVDGIVLPPGRPEVVRMFFAGL